PRSCSALVRGPPLHLSAHAALPGRRAHRERLRQAWSELQRRTTLDARTALVRRSPRAGLDAAHARAHAGGPRGSGSDRRVLGVGLTLAAAQPLEPFERLGVELVAQVATRPV